MLLTNQKFAEIVACILLVNKSLNKRVLIVHHLRTKVSNGLHGSDGAHGTGK